MNKLLYPLSLAYSFLSNANRDLKKSEFLPKPVISVGNITWGGTGKTPMVIELLEFLIKNKMKPAVLTRGYGRKSSRSVLLQDGAEDVDVADSGDEPLLIARSVPRADIIVGSERYENALKYKNETSPDVYVLDDGFQHWKIERNLDIICVNAANPFGNGMLIPAGILREKPEEMRRAGIIIITNADMVSAENIAGLEREIFIYSGRKAVITEYGSYEYVKTNLREIFDFQTLKKSKIYALSGIGFSEGFQNSVKKSGLEIEECIKMDDHQKYDKEKVRAIFKKISGDSCLVITSKDAVKLHGVMDGEMKERTAVLKVKPIFKTGKEQWENAVLKSLQPFWTGTEL